MFILMATPEAYPFAQTGKLGEVIYGLASSLVGGGHRVSVVLPLYREAREHGRPLTSTGIRLAIPLSMKTLEAEVYHTALKPDFDFYFIAQDSLYNRDGLYGTCYGDFQDNAERFIFFSRAVVEMVAALGLEFDVCHCHDWQTGLVPVYGHTLYRDRPHYRHPPVVYSVHNAAYQGIFPAHDFSLTGLDWGLLSPKALEFYGKINFMKGGLVFADLLSTVSARYREEILTPEYGFGLEGIFHERAAELFGIPEGVDYSRWNTSNNAFLTSGYDKNHLEGKRACKAHLLTRFGLDLPLDRPLIGMNTHLVERKGIDLVENILEDLMRLEVGFVLQGIGEERHQYQLQEIQVRHPKRIGLFIGYSEELTHQIIAGSDIFLMPSRYEPGGLDQLCCLRYGTVPVMRATGGLAETIREYIPQTGEGNGFKFSAYSPEALLQAVQWALDLYRDRRAWETLLWKNMALDFSWDRLLPQYLELYRLAQEKRRRQLAS
ncbi:MAG: glycogen/starch synthase [Deltaproteobacteria bacterium]|nr:glycogen/starch synthase [Deltaproteobacteria bacterium]